MILKYLIVQICVDYYENLPEPMVDVQAFFNNEILYIVGGITEDGYSGSGICLSGW